jgi:amino acid transporter
MIANLWLVVFIYGFYSLLVAWAKFENWLQGKRWSDGPCLFPLFPIACALLLIGSLINLVAPPWGTWAIVALHLIVFVSMSVLIWFHPAEK